MARRLRNAVSSPCLLFPFIVSRRPARRLSLPPLIIMFSASLLLPIALSLKPMLASAQATTLSGVDTPTETYPATPLADKRFSYPSGIVRVLHALHSFSSTNQVIASTSRCRQPHSWYTVWLQLLRRLDRWPGLEMPDKLPEPSRWCVYFPRFAPNLKLTSTC